jgi:RNA polymerase sigma factor (sigma-70 family)
MIRDEQLDAILGMLGGEFDDAELDSRAASFRGALRRLRDDPAEAARIDALATDAGDDPPAPEFRGALRRLRDDPAEAARIDALVTHARDDLAPVSLTTRGMGGQATAAALVTRAVEGDPVAWVAIVDRYAPLVWSICSRFQLSNSDREDVAQKVWLLLVEQLGKLREPAALPGWLAITTHRECLRVVTAARKRERLGAGLDDALQFADDTMIEEEILTAERRTALRAAFAELPPHCQQLLALLTSDPPYSYAEISEHLGIPVGSIGPQRARCLARLRKSIALAGLGATEPRREHGEHHA